MDVVIVLTPAAKGLFRFCVRELEDVFYLLMELFQFVSFKWLRRLCFVISFPSHSPSTLGVVGGRALDKRQRREGK